MVLGVSQEGLHFVPNVFPLGQEATPNSEKPFQAFACDRGPHYLPKPIPEDVVLDAFDQATTAESAMLCLAGTQDLRRSEIASAHPKNRDGKTLRVQGKGRRERIVPLDGMTYSLLVQIESEQGCNEFYFKRRFGGHLHDHTVYVWVKRHLGSDWSTHNLRHRAASHGLQTTKDIRGVQELLGIVL